VIYNGVDLDSFHPTLREKHHEQTRRTLGIPSSARIVLFVGSGFERKGLPQLMAALQRLNDPDVHLVVVGEDRLQRRLAEQARALAIAARVHWPGPQQDVRPFYGAADCLGLPTLYDPFPNAALEALASGLPVLTSSRCGAAELIEEGRSGYVCQAPEDIDDLVHKLSRTVSEAPAMRNSARAAAEPYGLAAMAAALIRLYDALLPENARSSVTYRREPRQAL
jgi:UDP-glucose:(heptosyl)LPS alpha-1,3-glucosyltransferase